MRSWGICFVHRKSQLARCDTHSDAVGTGSVFAGAIVRIVDK